MYVKHCRSTIKIKETTNPYCLIVLMQVLVGVRLALLFNRVRVSFFWNNINKKPAMVVCRIINGKSCRTGCSNSQLLNKAGCLFKTIQLEMHASEKNPLYCYAPVKEFIIKFTVGTIQFYYFVQYIHLKIYFTIYLF